MFCEKCGEYLNALLGGTREVCRCKVFIIIDADGEEHNIQSSDDRSAALKYAEKSNVENEYYLMDESIEITVNGKKFRISAEPDVHYSAEDI